jgi:peptide-N4-(N-acetyl-beta-glucosaminyl)asparagine amidase
MLRAAGYEARHVCDNADHVWCEYYSPPLGRWLHVDSCEGAWDTPLLYEGGWGKRLAWVLAASQHGHTDVTKCVQLCACRACCD